ncbi:MAG: site-2 protease family protein [Candidatus Eisenbacteria bacterium]|nr:site-2 protease family protein [Candidatus Eisenbacteria bacterium]
MSNLPPSYRSAGETMEFDPVEGAWIVRPQRKPFPTLHALLFVLTVGSTILAGGFAYSFSLLGILLAHEMGHYLTARRHGIPSTLPYFLPLPSTIFGTMGAVIKMDGRNATRRQLFDVGVAGPLAGVVVAIPITWVGIRLSSVVGEGSFAGALSLGDSILFSALQRLVHGPLPEGQTLLLHPMAFAGWAGLYVTALNLVPVGQLDGGHVLYGLFGPRAARISLVALVAFALLAISTYRYWLVFVFLILFFGYRHPPMLDEEVGLDSPRRWIGAATLALFLLVFTPIPIR